jgi:hypothetical protein
MLWALKAGEDDRKGPTYCQGIATKGVNPSVIDDRSPHDPELVKALEPTPLHLFDNRQTRG